MYHRQPKYYSEFKCSGSECKSNCCFGWYIEWSKEEVDKVKNAAGCSPQLKEIVEIYFIPTSQKDENKYFVKFNENG